MIIRKLKKEEINLLAPLMASLYKKWDKTDPIDKIDKKMVFFKRLCRNDI